MDIVKDHIKTHKTTSMDISRQQKRLERHIDKICSSYLYLNSMQQAQNPEYYQINETLLSLQGVFQSDNSDLLFELTQKNHSNSREILYVGGMYHANMGNTTEAFKYFNGLADYYKKLDQKEEYLKYRAVADKFA